MTVGPALGNIARPDNCHRWGLGDRMPHTFQNLRQPNIGEKIFKFTQGKSIAALNPRQQANHQPITTLILTEEEFDGVRGGVCAALACSWLEQKMSWKHDDFEGPFTGAAIHTAQNLASTENAVPKYLAYAKAGSNDRLMKLYGLKVVEQDGFRMARQRVQQPNDKRGMPVFDSEIVVTDTMIAACSEQNLKQGSGAYIGVRCESIAPGGASGGHAVALYRSKGNTLYFFDPNCGVYKVFDATFFFTEWVSGYAALGYGVEMWDSRTPVRFVKH